MAKQEFKFLEAYRTMVPTASRDVVDARQKSHDKLYPQIKTMERVYDLCRLAFELPYDSAALADWFEKPVKEFDVQFSIELDKAEAGRIAALLLRDIISRGTTHYAFAVLVSSYCGRRAPVGGSELLIAARDTTVEAGKERRVVLAHKKIAFPAGKDLKAELEAIQANFSGPTVRAGLDALAADLRDGAAKLATSSNEAFQSLNSDATRMAEELDMLWWHIGDWSELLDKPRGNVPEKAVAVVSGAELGG
ncbi:MAG: GTPase-associated system all-helical protein GASH, partial [Xanthobacteraceae bacterium]